MQSATVKVSKGCGGRRGGGGVRRFDDLTDLLMLSNIDLKGHKNLNVSK